MDRENCKSRNEMEELYMRGASPDLMHVHIIRYQMWGFLTLSSTFRVSQVPLNVNISELTSMISSDRDSVLKLPTDTGGKIDFEAKD